MPGALRVMDFTGRYHTEPSTRTQITAAGSRRVALDNPFTPTFLGRFIAGGLDEVHEFRDLQEFLEVHDPEGNNADLAAKLARYIFQPGTSLQGPPGGPSLVRTVRVGQGAQVPTGSTLAINDITPEAVITASSIDAGTYTNQLRLKIEAATSGGGRKLSVGFRDKPAWVKVGDKLGPLFTLDYTGNAGTAAVTVTRVADKATRVQIILGGPTDGSVSLDIDLTSSDFATVQQVVDYIARQIGYIATPIEGDVALSDVPSYEIDSPGPLDLVAAGPTIITANIGALVAWVAVNCTKIGPVPGIIFTRVATKVAQPAVMAAFANLAGGSQPAVIAADWDAALAVLVREEVTSGLLVVDTTDAAVQAQITAWIDDQLTNHGRIWRAVYGLPDTTTPVAARTYAGKVDNTRIGVLHQRLVDFNDETVTQTTLYGAAAVAGATGGMNFENDVQSVVLTSDRFRFGGILKADKQTKSVREASLDAGVMVWRERRGGQVLLSLGRSTYAEKGDANDRFRMMWSESIVLDAIAISIEDRLKPLEVAWATDDYVANVRDEATQVLRTWATRGFITAGIDPASGASYPAFTPPVVTVANGQTYISSDLGMTGETDHLRIGMTVRRLALTSEG